MCGEEESRKRMMGRWGKMRVVEKERSVRKYEGGTKGEEEV